LTNTSCTCNKVWAGTKSIDKKTTDANDPLKVHVELLDLLKNFQEVSVPAMLIISQKVWSVPDPTTKQNNGISMLCIHERFGTLLFASLSSEFPLYVQNKIPDSLLLDGPLIWIAIAHAIYLSALPMLQMLKQDLLHLNLAQLDDNCA
jgi:hypothetical protein